MTLQREPWKNANILRKTINSLNGFRVAFMTEDAIMQESIALLVLVILAVILGCDGGRVFLVFLACLLPITLELVNSAFEIIIDLTLGTTYNEGVRRAKDMLSAAVSLALLIGYCGSLWMILF